MNHIWLLFCFLSLPFLAHSQEYLQLPHASENPYQNALYLAYQREMQSAADELMEAQKIYTQKNDPDSLALAMITRARMLTLTRRSEASKLLMDTVYQLLSSMEDTLDVTKAFLPFVETGNYLAEFDIGRADSSGKEALRIIRSTLGDCNMTLIKMLNDYGIIRFYQGDYLEADSLVNLSLECADKLLSDIDMRKMPSFNLGGTIKDYMGYHQESVNLYNAALEIMESNDRDSTYDYARLLNNLAGAVYDNGGALEAIKIYERSLKLTEDFEDVYNNRVGVYYNIANMLNSIGYRNKALEYVNKSIQLMEAKDFSAPNKHYMYMLKATILAHIDRIGEIPPEISKAKAYLLDAYQDDYSVQVEFLRRYAAVLSTIGDTRKSIEVIDSTLNVIQTKELDKNVVDRGEFYFIGGQAALNLGDTGRAISYFKSSVEDFIEGSPRQQKNAALSLSHLSDVYIDLNEIDKAISGVLQSDSILVDQGMSISLLDQIDLSDYFPLQHLRDVLYVKLKLLFHLYTSSGDIQYLEHALSNSYALEDEINDKISAYLEEEDAVSRTSEYYKYYGLIVQVRMTAADVFERSELTESALMSVESTKDLLFKNALRSAVRPSKNIPDSIILYEQKLLAQIDRLKKEVVELQLDKKDVDKQKIELIEQERKWDQYKLSLQNSYPKYYDERFKSDALNIEQIQTFLNKSRSTAIQYFLEDGYAGAFVISPDSISFVQIQPNSLLEPLLKKAIEDIRSLGGLSSLNLCYRSIFKPIEQLILTENVIVIPDGYLHFVPFEAFIDDKERFLVNRFTFSYNHSLNFGREDSSSEKRRSILAVAPGFNESVMDNIQNLGGDYPSDNIVRQPNALELSKNVLQYIPGVCLSESDATEDQFYKNLDQTNMLLIASHAEVDEAHPLYSRIALLPDSENKEDGLVHAYEIMSKNLKHRLAILSACQTGLGELDRGQGASSLSQAFRIAGCQNVLMSLWSIDEKQSVNLVEQFLSDLSNDDFADELTKTKRKYLLSSSPELQHPFYWSGLVLVGTDLPGNNSKASLWIVWAIAVGIIFMALNLWKRSSQS